MIGVPQREGVGGPAAAGAPSPIRLAVIDDDTPMREGLPGLLPDHEVLATCATVAEFLTCHRLPPGGAVALLDLHLNGEGDATGLQGRRAVQAVAERGWTVLIYTNERRRVVLAGCYLAGAKGIVHKTETMDRLRSAIVTVHSGRTVVTPAVAGLLDAIARAGNLRELTERQRAVLHGRARGETFKAIGESLYISPRTAEEYMGDVVAKFRGLLEHTTPAELERQLGLAPGDLME